MKRYLVLVFFWAGTAASQAQSISFHDLINLVTQSVPQVNNVLVQAGRFKVKDKALENGQIITYYQPMDKNKNALKGEIMITGWYKTAGDGTNLHALTYQTIYPEYVLAMMKDIEKYGYHLSFKGIDTQKRTFIYDNSLNHVTVTMANDHSVNSVEINQKGLEIEQ